MLIQDFVFIEACRFYSFKFVNSMNLGSISSEFSVLKPGFISEQRQSTSAPIKQCKNLGGKHPMATDVYTKQC